MTEPIGIDEAIHDYQTARKDYQHKQEQLEHFMQNDEEVLRVQLAAYLDIEVDDVGVTEDTVKVYLHNHKVSCEFLKRINALDCKYSIYIDDYDWLVVLLDLSDSILEG